MQNIRRATKKHRNVLLAVVVLLMLGLVGSFATWNAASSGNGAGAAESDGTPTLEQQIASSEEYVASMLAEYGDNPDYSACLSLATAYLDLSYLYWNQYNAGVANADSENADSANADSANANSVAQEKMLAMAQQAETYYQQALDSAPEGLNDAAIADIKAGQASTREMQDDLAGALAYMNEASELNPDNINFVYARASLEQTMGNLEGALALFDQLSALYPENTQLMTSRASLLAELGDDAQARELYLQARTLAPEDFNVAYSYASFLFSFENLEAAVAELMSYRMSLPEGHAGIEQADNGIANLEGWANLLAGLNSGGEDGATEEGGEEESAEGESVE